MSANKLPVYTGRTVDSLATSSNDLYIPISDGVLLQTMGNFFKIN